MAIGLAISHKLTEALHLLFTFKLYIILDLSIESRALL